MLCDEIHTLNCSDNITHEDINRTYALNKILTYCKNQFIGLSATINP
jgi:hypothetical protein